MVQLQHVHNAYCHLSIEGFACAIKQAVSEIENAVPQLIAEKVAAIMATN